MGFLKSFFQNVFREETAPVGDASSFERLTEEQLNAHLAVARYGDFLLSEAVRPSFDLKITPRQGYRHDSYRDEDGTEVPVLMAAASKEILFELFMDMLDPLGREVDVVIETSHHRQASGHQDLYREQIDLPVLKSILWDYEDLIVNDGCAGLAVLNPKRPQEVQFGEHKLLIVYGEPLAPFEAVLKSHGLRCDESMRFITEAEHVHSSSEEYFQLFERLQFRLGIDGAYEGH
jgi:hypothetical protein